MLKNDDIKIIQVNFKKINELIDKINKNSETNLIEKRLFSLLNLIFFYLNQPYHFYNNEENILVINNLLEELKIIINDNFFSTHNSVYIHYLIHHTLDFLKLLKKDNLSILEINNQNFEKNFQNVEKIVANQIPKNYQTITTLNKKEKKYYLKIKNEFPIFFEGINLDGWNIKQMTKSKDSKLTENILIVNLEFLCLLLFKGNHLKYFSTAGNILKKNKKKTENYEFIKKININIINEIKNKNYKPKENTKNLVDQFKDMSFKKKICENSVINQIININKDKWDIFKKKLITKMKKLKMKKKS
jgi:hypothetical protein